MGFEPGESERRRPSAGGFVGIARGAIEPLAEFPEANAQDGGELVVEIPEAVRPLQDDEPVEFARSSDRSRRSALELPNAGFKDETASCLDYAGCLGPRP